MKIIESMIVIDQGRHTHVLRGSDLSQGWRNSTKFEVLALHGANSGLILGILYIPLSTNRYDC